MNTSDDLPALVVVVNNTADWARVVNEGWYRIPVKHAPPAVAASFLAFYHTQKASATPFAISWYAPVVRYRQALRRELLPAESQHPRAAEQYYVIELGSLVALPQPIASHKLRRITFIPTTFGRLLRAKEINDLWLGDAAEDLVWAWFRDAGIKAERRLEIAEGDQQYVADLAVQVGDHGLAIFYDTAPTVSQTAGWQWLVLARTTIAHSTSWQAQLQAALGALAERAIDDPSTHAC